MRVLSSEKRKPVSVALSQQPPFSKSKTTAAASDAGKV